MMNKLPDADLNVHHKRSLHFGKHRRVVAWEVRA